MAFGVPEKAVTGLPLAYVPLIGPPAVLAEVAHKDLPITRVTRPHQATRPIGLFRKTPNALPDPTIKAKALVAPIAEPRVPNITPR